MVESFYHATHILAAACNSGNPPTSLIDTSCLPSVSADSGRLQIIMNTVLSVVGAICLLVITIAGFRYVVSHGDPNIIAQSKQAIIYALIGLVICLSAFGIVNFVAGRL